MPIPVFVDTKQQYGIVSIFGNLNSCAVWLTLWRLCWAALWKNQRTAISRHPNSVALYLGHPAATVKGNRLWEFDLNAVSLFLLHLFPGLQGLGEVGKRGTLLCTGALNLWVWADLHRLRGETQSSGRRYPLTRFQVQPEARESLVIGWCYRFCKHDKVLSSSNKIILKVTTKFNHTHNHDGESLNNREATECLQRQRSRPTTAFSKCTQQRLNPYMNKEGLSFKSMEIK